MNFSHRAPTEIKISYFIKTHLQQRNPKTDMKTRRKVYSMDDAIVRQQGERYFFVLRLFSAPPIAFKISLSRQSTAPPPPLLMMAQQCTDDNSQYTEKGRQTLVINPNTIKPPKATVKRARLFALQRATFVEWQKS